MQFIGVIQILISVVLNVIVTILVHHLHQVTQQHTIVIILHQETHHIWVYQIVGEVVIKLQETHQYHSRGKEHYIIHVLLVLLILTLVIHVLQTDVKT